jgi:hypothetical protein
MDSRVQKRLDKIRSTGYWRIHIRPTVYKSNRILSLSELRNIIEGCMVTLRGWNFPHLDHEETVNGDHWIESGADFREIVEYWRFYQSGQFIHYAAMGEDYLVEKIETILLDLGKSQNNRYLNISDTLFTVTEVFEFIARLIAKGIYTDPVHVSIKLVGTNNRLLFFWHSQRNFFLRGKYICYIDEINYPTDQTDFNSEDILSKSSELALDATFSIFERFNWNKVPMESLREDQKKLLERRL